MLAFHGLFNTFLWKEMMSEPAFYNVKSLKRCRAELGLRTGTEKSRLPNSIWCKKKRWQEILVWGWNFWPSLQPQGFCPQNPGSFSSKWNRNVPCLDCCLDCLECSLLINYTLGFPEVKNRPWRDFFSFLKRIWSSEEASHLPCCLSLCTITYLPQPWPCFHARALSSQWYADPGCASTSLLISSFVQHLSRWVPKQLVGGRGKQLDPACSPQAGPGLLVLYPTSSSPYPRFFVLSPSCSSNSTYKTFSSLSPYFTTPSTLFLYIIKRLRS